MVRPRGWGVLGASGRLCYIRVEIRDRDSILLLYVKPNTITLCNFFLLDYTYKMDF
jgi:hypothetical protein